VASVCIFCPFSRGFENYLKTLQNVIKMGHYYFEGFPNFLFVKRETFQRSDFSSIVRIVAEIMFFVLTRSRNHEKII
jgi:hypothetical protein